MANLHAVMQKQLQQQPRLVHQTCKRSSSMLWDQARVTYQPSTILTFFASTTTSCTTLVPTILIIEEAGKSPVIKTIYNMGAAATLTNDPTGAV
ncbi:hypothetical protein CcCBS67573_g06965 [Chytriomyces confervae]|uniref:Uncharacterized protein n=1 Tax=Chytriomyces confervae TaxID=246404 RepID=A0A507F0T6_9FUNG|nr:hypothetical protein HDU80_000412 [Chytriomyces hyalinus]TPX68998.1 hypothetical protein CcCBS67573_g06965 [Chytriomyces confervae]